MITERIKNWIRSSQHRSWCNESPGNIYSSSECQCDCGKEDLENLLSKKKSLIYLAVPYSHPDSAVMEERFNRVNRVAARLMREGLHIYSPISHSHSIALAGELPRDWEFWKEYDQTILSMCGKLIVLTLDGWQESKGVMAEIQIAKDLELEIEYIYE